MGIYPTEGQCLLLFFHCVPKLVVGKDTISGVVVTDDYAHRCGVLLVCSLCFQSFVGGGGLLQMNVDVTTEVVDKQGGTQIACRRGSATKLRK